MNFLKINEKSTATCLPVCVLSKSVFTGESKISLFLFIF